MQQASLWSRPWTVLARRHPSAFLLAAQLLSLMIYPSMDDTSSGRLLFGAVALVVVPLAVWVVNRSSSVHWVAWLLAVPAIALTAAGFGASFTAVVVSNDMTTGLIDRLRTMPFPAVTVLLGHTVASMARNLLATVVVMLVALAVGYRTDASALSMLGALGLIALWILAITVVFATLGMLAGSAEAASGYGFVLLFLPYLSSGYAPVESMPTWLRVFAEHQPMTPLIDAARALMDGQDPGADALISVLWCAVIIAIALVVAAYVFPRRTAR